MNERCLQTMTGSCGGCNVLEIVKGRIDVATQSRVDTSIPVDKDAIAARVAAEYCPVGTIIQMPSRVKQSVW